MSEEGEAKQKGVFARRIEKQNLMPHERLSKLLSYDPVLGKFTWLVTITRQKGAPGGCLYKDGYIYIKVCNLRFMAHRVAWCLHYGDWPEVHIDHKDGVRSNNKMENLRLATMEQNQWNMKTPSHNTSGAKGVRYIAKSGMYEARIVARYKTYMLGTYPTLEQATEAYNAGSKEIHGDFGRLNS